MEQLRLGGSERFRLQAEEMRRAAEGRAEAGALEELRREKVLWEQKREELGKERHGE